jgi:hypothetical protein
MARLEHRSIESKEEEWKLRIESKEEVLRHKENEPLWPHMFVKASFHEIYLSSA